MAPYIDLDRYIARINSEDIVVKAKDTEFKYEQGYLSGLIQASIAAKTMPTADVVPRSEVDLYRKQVDELEDELASAYDKLEKAKAEVAREIFAEIGERLSVVEGHRGLYTISEADITELKKKYTEGTNI